jgi:hypothetical protein
LWFLEEASLGLGIRLSPLKQPQGGNPYLNVAYAPEASRRTTAVTHCSFSPNGQHLVTVRGETVSTYGVPSLAHEATLHGFASFSCAAVSNTGRVVAGDELGNVWIASQCSARPSRTHPCSDSSLKRWITPPKGCRRLPNSSEIE